MSSVTTGGLALDMAVILLLHTNYYHHTELVWRVSDESATIVSICSWKEKAMRHGFFAVGCVALMSLLGMPGATFGQIDIPARFVLGKGILNKQVDILATEYQRC